MSRKTNINITFRELRLEVFDVRERNENCIYLMTFLLQLKEFSLQLLHRKLQFTACDFFALDFTLLHSVSAPQNDSSLLY